MVNFGGKQSRHSYATYVIMLGLVWDETDHDFHEYLCFSYHCVISQRVFSKGPSFKLDPEVDDQNNHGAFK